MKKILSIVLLVSLAFMSCEKKNKSPEPQADPIPQTPSYTIPTTYTFSNVNYASAKQALEMLSEITTYIKTAHITGDSPALNASQLLNMYENKNSPYSSSALNASSTQLKSQTSNLYKLPVACDSLFHELEVITTPTTAAASMGVAGKLISGTKAYVVDADGFEYKEVFEKGIMGAVFYDKAMNLLINISSYDNTTVVPGEGTAQEHAWDMAFGFFGVPLDFPTNTSGLKNWGSYCNAVNTSISSNATLMNAFLKGRAAISNKDVEARNQARNIIVSTWEKIAAAKLITYAKSAKTTITDDALRSHSLSEAVGFVNAFRYNPSKTISDAQIEELLLYFGSNLYVVDPANLDKVINLVATVFSLDANTL